MDTLSDLRRVVPTLADGSDTPELPADHRLQRSASIGYKPVDFAGKLDQRELVVKALQKQEWIPVHKIKPEVNFFYDKLGIDDLYFSEESVDTIAGHILSLYGAKCTASGDDNDSLQVKLVQEAEDHAIYMNTSFPGVTDLQGPMYETRLEEKYLNHNPHSNKVFRVESFRSKLSGVGKAGQELRSYFVNQCHFNNESPSEDELSNLELVSDKSFFDKATDNTKRIYSDMIKSVLNRTGPVIDRYEIAGTDDWRVVVGLRRGTGENLFAALSDLYHYYGMTSTRKYVEQFSNGICVMSIYLTPGPDSSKFPAMKAAVYQLVREASLLYCIPRSTFHSQFVVGEISLQESIYAHCVAIFVTHFLNRLGRDYEALRQQLDPDNAVHQQLLSKIKRRLRSETYTRNDIHEVIRKNPKVVRLLYKDFASVHRITPVKSSPQKNDSRSSSPAHFLLPNGSESLLQQTASFQDLQRMEKMSAEELDNFIAKNTNDEHEYTILSAFITFNKHVLKTSFYQPTKSSLSFRFDPSFLPAEEYPQPLFAMFLVVGAEFRGFHLRFKDVARGGIRIVMSRSKEAYSINLRSMFDENYALAATQQKKNKDIPEGGAKGVLLLDADAQDKSETAFHKYIDGLIDLLIEGKSPNIKDKIVDLYGKEETLYCGPDENTAGLVDWATKHAKSRGAPWWKSFFTGKSKSLGGIPHDAYGMTSLSVREYVLGVYRKLGLKQETITKIQTGGPDGDLGSNEILLSNEKMVAIIDGSGVLCDPHGLDRTELVRLAKARRTIDNYDDSLLSSDGYRVLIDDSEKKLPTGEVVARGTDFRNTAHLRNFGAGLDGRSADVVVPCGGRPEAINISNVNQLIDEQGRSRISYIVEGANLFVTQDARLALEKAGCIVFKDASTNKGGVTSSSLEVLASLCFDDDGFIKHMCVRDSREPEFYSAYVKQIQQIIKANAQMEFEAIWREHENSGIPRALLSDQLSQAIVNLQDELQYSSLWTNIPIRNVVLKKAIPSLLIDKIGFETLIDRVGEAYLRALFGSYLASRFVYQYGVLPSQFKMYEFISSFKDVA